MRTESLEAICDGPDEKNIDDRRLTIIIISGLSEVALTWSNGVKRGH